MNAILVLGLTNFRASSIVFFSCQGRCTLKEEEFAGKKYRVTCSGTFVPFSDLSRHLIWLLLTLLKKMFSLLFLRKGF